MEKEKKYLIDNVKAAKQNRSIYVDEFIYLPPHGKENEISRIHTIDAWITKINSLSSKIYLSFNQSIEYCSEIDDSKFSMVKREKTKEEFMCYYFLENGIYRLISLWDVLAQLSNICFETGVNKSQIGYKKFFIGKKTNSNKDITVSALMEKRFNDFSNMVSNYINEKDDINVDGVWKGNHNYISRNIRNPLVHCEDPHEFSVLDCEINFINHPLYELKRATEDYAKVDKFLTEILDIIDCEMASKTKYDLV